MDIKCVSVSDFGKVCRICMKFAETLLAITSFQIIEMVSSCSSVQIWENDNLPNQICNACFLQLQNTIHFQQLCEKSDHTFRQIIEQHKKPNELNVNVIIKSEENDLKNDDNHFNDNESLSSTSLENSDKNEKFNCEKCGKQFKKAWVLGQHMYRAHRATPLTCTKCAIKCYHVLHLKEHEELAHNPLNHTCDICNRQFTDIYKLKRHKFIHSTHLNHCSQCDKSFKDKWSLKNHIREVHSHAVKNIACHACGKSILKKNLSIHMQTHSERNKFSCVICLKTFFYRQSLDNHVKYVHDNQIPKRNYLCNICGRAVRSSAELRRHLLIHTKERPHACDHCDKTYRRPEALKKHVLRVHLDERNFVCTFCSQAFYDKDILLNHVRRHTGERPFKCSLCDKAFIQKIALKIHMKVHINST